MPLFVPCLIPLGLVRIFWRSIQSSSLNLMSGALDPTSRIMVFVNKIKNLRIEEYETLLSFDVVSHFTMIPMILLKSPFLVLVWSPFSMIPIDKAIEIIGNCTFQEIAKLCFCLKSNFCSFQSEICKQNCSVANGITSTPCGLANLFM